jgi:Raf kinase inhibitor-like YbhB/YbcL family protein
VVRALLATLCLLAACGSAPAGLTVTSASFVDGGDIPKTFTCTGGGQVPDIAWSGDRHGAAALAVVVDDPDAPGGTFVHRVVLDLPPTTTHLSADPPPGAHQADNSAGTPGWTAPCPPSGTHHYRFTVYGLSKPTDLPDGTAPDKAIQAITSTAVTQGRLTGLVTH